MRFMCTHTLPPNAVSPDQLKQMAKAGQNDPQVRGYRSFVNISEGKAVCLMDAPDKKTLTAWFQKMQMPFDSIVPLEYEGDRGTITEVAARQPSMA